jgi:hypothetical protein
MKNTEQNPRVIVGRFLEKIGEPVSEEQSDRAVSSVLERLRAKGVSVSRFPVIAAPVLQTQSRGWSAIAAAVVVILAGGLLHILLERTAKADFVARPVGGEIHAVGKSAAFLKYSRIESGRVVKAGRIGGAVALSDGSQVDMSPDAELSVVRETGGLRVKLASGVVLVTAARQRQGNLYVETKDCVVSVTGTVFAVSAEERGSSVTVLEGEVQVQSGDVSRTLLAGEQASTNSQSLPLPAQPSEKDSPEHLALVQQPPTFPTSPLPAGAAITVRGMVRSSTGEGIPDVTVALCPNGTREANATVSDAATRAPFDDTVFVDAPVRRQKAFFFAHFSQPPKGCTPTTVMTNSMGRFEFSNLAAGEYAVRAEREGFSGPLSPIPAVNGIFRYFNKESGHFSESRSSLSGDSKPVTVSAQQSPQEISLTLIRAGVITGRVRDSEGRLLVNAQVRVLTPPAQGAAGDGLNLITTMTNDLGEYRAYWLLPGEYRVVAAAPGRPLAEIWFSGGATAAEATLVSVREGETVSNVDIVLRPR